MKKLVLLLLLLLIIPTKANAEPRGYWWRVAMQVGATVYDNEMTMRGLNRGGEEINPLYGTHPGRLRLYGVSMALTGAFCFWQHKMRQANDPHAANTFSYVITGLHVGAGTSNWIQANGRPELRGPVRASVCPARGALCQ